MDFFSSGYKPIIVSFLMQLIKQQILANDRFEKKYQEISRNSNQHNNKYFHPLLHKCIILYIFGWPLKSNSYENFFRTAKTALPVLNFTPSGLANLPRPCLDKLSEIRLYP